MIGSRLHTARRQIILSHYQSLTYNTYRNSCYWTIILHVATLWQIAGCWLHVHEIYLLSQQKDKQTASQDRGSSCVGWLYPFGWTVCHTGHRSREALRCVFVCGLWGSTRSWRICGRCRRWILSLVKVNKPFISCTNVQHIILYYRYTINTCMSVVCTQLLQL